MTEKEKAAKGLLYNANHDKELLSERDRARAMLFEYNNLHPLEYDKKGELLRKLLAEIKDGFIIEQPFHVDYGYNTYIGENFYANNGLIILDGAKVTIGDNVFIAPYVGIYTAGHPLDIKRRNEGLEYAYPVTIGDDVWIGGGVSILPGVTIGNGAVIGAGSIVKKDIPPNVMAAGNPCKIIREITEMI